MLAEPVLPGGVARDVGAVVVEQAGLDVLLAGPAEEGERVSPQVRDLGTGQQRRDRLHTGELATPARSARPSGVPTATTLPRSDKATRSHSRSASSM